ncbi:hypothetical protein E2C01_002959 [Portunus trituberculatus]|uniref:Uncharacterized protein n=1 Tax=Portunus trituberculatus TaxID=210409 RepID=A0A5B7CM54_PORTR|nr:hypothetical protein [Portunus trituberculatus]
MKSPSADFPQGIRDLASIRRPHTNKPSRLKATFQQHHVHCCFCRDLLLALDMVCLDAQSGDATRNSYTRTPSCSHLEEELHLETAAQFCTPLHQRSVCVNIHDTS